MKIGGRSCRFAGHRLALDDWRVGRRRGDFDGDVVGGRKFGSVQKDQREEQENGQAATLVMPCLELDDGYCTG